MAELFLARDTRSHRLVVIKRILPYLSQEGEFVQMFLDEARIAAQLHHPNVIEVFELGKLEDSIFIAMEFVDGIDLRNILGEELKLGGPAGGSVPFKVAAWICARICDGLHYAHNRAGLDGRPLEIIHRDISPQNVMVGYDGRVKLVDFGIARANAFMERSKPGVIKGKFLYLAPEQLTQEGLDHRADLFALGTMLYEVTTGKSPFYKNSTEAVILAIRNEDPPPPHLVRADYPLELSRIIMRCLTKDRSRRYQQAGEIAQDLDLFLQRAGGAHQSSIIDYVASLFGGEGERTMLHIPGRALPPLPERPRGPPPDEATRPMAPVPRRRPTAEENAQATFRGAAAPGAGPEEDDDEVRTQMARPRDLEKALGTTAPGRRPSAERSLPLDTLDLQERTATGFSGITDPTPEATLPLTASGVTAPTAPERHLVRPRTGPQRLLDGPVFDQDVLPPEARTRPERPAGPRSGPRSGPRPRIAPGPQKPWPEPGDLLPPRIDPDDEESTANLTGASLSVTSTTPGGGPPRHPDARRIIFGAVAVALAIVAVAGIVRFLRADDGPVPIAAQAGARPAVMVQPEPEAAAIRPSSPAPRAAPEAVPAKAPAPGASSKEGEAQKDDGQSAPAGMTAAQAAAAAEGAPPRVDVIFVGPRGTRITVGRTNYVPGRRYTVASGSHRLFYQCPRGYSGRGNRLQPFDSGGESKVQKVSIPCKRK